MASGEKWGAEFHVSSALHLSAHCELGFPLVVPSALAKIIYIPYKGKKVLSVLN
jgi:hypothetical protein